MSIEFVKVPTQTFIAVIHPSRVVKFTMVTCGRPDFEPIGIMRFACLLFREEGAGYVILKNRWPDRIRTQEALEMLACIAQDLGLVSGYQGQ